MRYKVGDKVRVKSAEWYNTFKNSSNDIRGIDNFCFSKAVYNYCGKEAIITDVITKDIISDIKPYYKIDIDKGIFNWSDYMLDAIETVIDNRRLLLPQGWIVDKVTEDRTILKDKITGTKVLLKAHNNKLDDVCDKLDRIYKEIDKSLDNIKHIIDQIK